nr:CAP domain-containing protein [Pseudonocardia sp.]
VELTNAERTDAGCDPLDTDPRLAAAAQGHAEDMSRNGYFDHVSQDGRRFDDRINARGYPSPGGENIAQGQESAAEVVAAWMNSPGHRRNILDCEFTAIGVGFDDDGDYWVQNFGF